MSPLSLMRVHPSFFKYRLLDAMNGANNTKIWFHEDIDMDFAEQITGEVLVEEINAKTNMPRQYFKVVHKPQDYFDCAQYAFCAIHAGRTEISRLNKKPEVQTDTNFAQSTTKKFVPPQPKKKRIMYAENDD